MFKKKYNNGVIHLDRNGLTLYFGPEIKPFDFKFNGTTVKNQEIIEPELFGSQLREFVEATGIKSLDCIIVLSDGLVYTKEIVSDEVSKEETERIEFIDKIPFDNAKIISKKVQLSEKSFFIATNKGLYKSIMNILKIYDWKVLSVIPEPFLSDGKLLVLDPSSVVKKRGDFSEYDFLSHENTERREKRSKKTLILVLLSIQVIIIILIILQRFKILG